MAHTPANDTDVLVVGAGPVGLTAACELSRHGARCRLIDSGSGPTPANESRALAVWQRTLEVFRGVGVIDRVLARGKKLHAMNIYKGGERLARIGLDLEDAETPYPSVISLPQGETERALIERLERHGGRVEWRTRLTDLGQDEGGVTATLVGDDDREASVRAGWLVGCDGAHSIVRHRLGLKFEGAEYEEPFLLADARVDWGLPGDEAHGMLSADGGVVAAFPLPEPGRWRLIDATAAVESGDPARVVGRFRELLHGQGTFHAELGDAAWAASFRIHRRVVDRLRAGRVFVAGDAAHIHSPIGGQGMNVGIQDAYNLAWKLALAARGLAGEALLDSYHAERHPVALQVLKGTDRATRVLTVKGELPRDLRDRLVTLVGKSGLARRRLLHAFSELGVAYRKSPVVGEDHPGLLRAVLPHSRGPGLRDHLDFASAPRPGDRAPDVVLPHEAPGGPARLFDLLSEPRHTLLLFSGRPDPGFEATAAAIGALISGRYVGLIRPWLVLRGDAESGALRGDGEVLRDPGGSLHRRYGAASPCLYLIRPDGYVGYRSQPPDADKLRAYLERLFVA
ncbi:MAG: FAD-dependent monooxygenase [Planctomycetia bacterium]|nr:FAD-dependent monooxygenase [Planctomycetia bacterium]